MTPSAIRRVTYRNLGWESAADIYLPPGFDEMRKYPAIVSTHPIGSCKEQTSGARTWQATFKRMDLMPRWPVRAK